MWLPIEHASGSRMDMAFDGAVAIFANRRIILEFLHGLVSVPKADNTLERFLWTVLPHRHPDPRPDPRPRPHPRPRPTLTLALILTLALTSHPQVLRCNEMTALLCVCTLWREIFSAPMRFLSGKGSMLDRWSVVSSADVLDRVYDAMVAIAADGHSLLDPSLDPFAPIAAQQPAFALWRDERAARVMKSPDGTPHCVYKRILAEARSPAGKGNAQAALLN